MPRRRIDPQHRSDFANDLMETTRWIVRNTAETIAQSRAMVRASRAASEQTRPLGDDAAHADRR